MVDRSSNPGWILCFVDCIQAFEGNADADKPAP
jgi:hypothetical protein